MANLENKNKKVNVKELLLGTDIVNRGDKQTKKDQTNLKV